MTKYIFRKYKILGKYIKFHQFKKPTHKIQISQNKYHTNVDKFVENEALIIEINLESACDVCY